MRNWNKTIELTFGANQTHEYIETRTVNRVIRGKEKTGRKEKERIERKS